MTIKQLQKQVDEWINEVGVRYFNETTNTLILVEEVGEFTRLMARKYGEQSFKNSEDEKNAEMYIEDELGDIVFVITCLANQMNIDIEKAFNKTMIKKSNRDIRRHKENPKLKAT
ncbi:MAG: nucleotide pyrophosphohydrolase [Saprospiraceae bacterium]|nr:nucleotide pyrophosphohydrolase [Saprospiraceae bacterium]